MMIDKSYTEFATPYAIVANNALAPREKMALLSDWKHDVTRLMESTHENMAPHGYQIMKDGVMLQNINIAMRALADNMITTEHYAR